MSVLALGFASSQGAAATLAVSSLMQPFGAPAKTRCLCLRRWPLQQARAALIPEQVWDGSPIPQRRSYPGRPTGSAMPLAWVHAELCHATKAAPSIDQKPPGNDMERQRERPLTRFGGRTRRSGQLSRVAV